MPRVSAALTTALFILAAAATAGVAAAAARSSADPAPRAAHGAGVSQELAQARLDAIALLKKRTDSDRTQVNTAKSARDIMSLFPMLDRDSSGKVSKPELKQGIGAVRKSKKAAGVHRWLKENFDVSDKVFDEVWDIADENADGELTVMEYGVTLDLLEVAGGEFRQKKVDVEDSYPLIDKNNDLKLTLEELLNMHGAINSRQEVPASFPANAHRFLKKYFAVLMPQTISEVFEAADESPTGILEVSEFVAMLDLLDEREREEKKKTTTAGDTAVGSTKEGKEEL